MNNKQTVKKISMKKFWLLYGSPFYDFLARGLSQNISFLLTSIFCCFLLFCASLIFLGCACRFLYGADTKDENKREIEKSLDAKTELKLEVIFYKKNGKKYVFFYDYYYFYLWMCHFCVFFLPWLIDSLSRMSIDICNFSAFLLFIRFFSSRTCHSMDSMNTKRNYMHFKPKH